MVMVNEQSWNNLQSGLKRVKGDLETNRFRNGRQFEAPKYPNKAKNSPRLPRLNSADSQSTNVQDLRRSGYNVVPPVHRSLSLESVTTDANADPRRNFNNQEQGIFTPPGYFNNHQKPKNPTIVPNKSINNFLPKPYTNGDDLKYKPKNSGRSDRDLPKKPEPEKYKSVKNQHPPLPTQRPPYVEPELAPTPLSQVERNRNIILQRNLSNGSQRSSLDEFVRNLKKEREVAKRKGVEPNNPYVSKKFDPLEKDTKITKLLHFYHDPEDGSRSPNGIYYGSNSDDGRNFNYEVIVDNLIWEVLEEDLIPDLLIETFLEAKDEQHKTSLSSFDNNSSTHSQHRMFMPWDNIKDATMPKLLEGKLDVKLPRVLTPPTLHYPWVNTITESHSDPALFAPKEETLFKKTVDRFVVEPIARSVQFDAMETLCAQVVDELAPDVAREALFDVILEDYINSNLLPEVVREESREVVMETLKKFDSRVEGKQRRAVNKYATEKLMDTFSLDHLLNLIAKSGKIFTEDQYKERVLDDVILTQLLAQYLNVRNQLNFTIRNGPLRRLHEKLVTDVAVEVILEELQSQLDEDLEDLHEYETSLDDPKMLEKSLKVAAQSNNLPDGLKNWIKSIDDTFAPEVPPNQQQPLPSPVATSLLPEPKKEQPVSPMLPHAVDTFPNMVPEDDTAISTTADNNTSIIANPSCPPVPHRPDSKYGPWAWLFATGKDGMYLYN